MVTHSQEQRIQKNNSYWIHTETRVLTQGYFSLGDGDRIAWEAVQTFGEGLGSQAMPWYAWTEIITLLTYVCF